jgi:hypothetical protein
LRDDFVLAISFTQTQYLSLTSITFRQPSTIATILGTTISRKETFLHLMLRQTKTCMIGIISSKRSRPRWMFNIFDIGKVKHWLDTAATTAYTRETTYSHSTNLTYV